MSAALVVNSEGLTADEEEHTLRSARKVTRALQPEYWRRIVRGEVKLRSVVAIARAAGAAARMRVTGGGGANESGDHPLDVLFDRLQAGGTRVIVACAEGEPFGEDLIRDGVPARMDRWPDIDLVTVAGRDHNVRPIVAQRDVHALLDRTLERELSAS